MNIQDLLAKLNGFKEGDNLEEGKSWMNQLNEKVKQFAPDLDIDLSQIKDFSSFQATLEKLKGYIGEDKLSGIANTAKNLFGKGGKGLFG